MCYGWGSKQLEFLTGVAAGKASRCTSQKKQQANKNIPIERLIQQVVQGKSSRLEKKQDGTAAVANQDTRQAGLCPFSTEGDAGTGQAKDSLPDLGQDHLLLWGCFGLNICLILRGSP